MLQSVLSLLSPGQWIIVGIAVVALLVINWPTVSGLFGRFKLPSIGTAAAGNEDAKDLEAFNRLVKRYERLGCKEGLAAMKTAGEHFLHTEGHS